MRTPAADAGHVLRRICPCHPPRIITAEPSAGGRITVNWLYDPRDEQGGPGAAYEARIYGDGGTGIMDWDTPLATVPMANPEAAAWWEWESDPLTDDVTYQFGVRIATAAHPTGIETENLTTASAKPQTDVPATPVLNAQVI